MGYFNASKRTSLHVASELQPLEVMLNMDTPTTNNERRHLAFNQSAEPGETALSFKHVYTEQNNKD